ncbi:ABC transporter ATP-binding protein [Gorillibacterium massiliense]|uniref:ABC transporter ATP-binding protein n=1 Tax=Gorillibacterium massiliense TaxID=1280390 RepID=UPI0009DFECD8|nr:ABC transporter ATP-binding protein [Gorillibacterium massiliense]
MRQESHQSDVIDSASQGSPHLELKDISVTFRDRGKPEPVLANISLRVEQGEFVSLVGPSGGGKSTLFHVIGGLVAPSSGSVWLEGGEVTGQKGLISYMPQNHALLPWRTIEDNSILAMEIAGASKQSARQTAREWLARVGLEGYEKAYPHMLSGGMKQRASFLRALLSPRSFMCLDEPFGALDELTRLDMQRWLLRIWEANKRSVLFITHSIEEAVLLSDRIYVLTGRPAGVTKEVTVPFPRPRGDEVVADPAFVALRQEIYEWMRRG